MVPNRLRYLRIATYYFRMIYGKINPWVIVRIFLTCKKIASASTDRYGCLRVVTSYIRISESYLRMLAIDYDLEIRKESREKSMYVNAVLLALHIQQTHYAIMSRYYVETTSFGSQMTSF